MIEGRAATTPGATATTATPVPPSTRRRGAARPVPERAEALAHLDLRELRAYRAELGHEENRVSYWRRLVQARIDVLAAAGDPAGLHDLGRLRGVLTDQRVASQRTAVLEVLPGDDRPPLPQLDALWESEPADDDARGELLLRLAAAERELSTYRTALHRRLDAATSELIARYHQNPSSCLVALPE
ncbi:MAG: RsiG family protein [Motilibacteraceae bacterium]